MTNEQILKQVIEKAEKNSSKGIMSGLIKIGYKLYWSSYVKGTKDIPEAYYGLIFSHDFAKAFWGEEEIMQEERFTMPKWKTELQQMVLEKDPIQYLKKFL